MQIPEDAAILEQFRQRNQRALTQTSQKYGAVCLKMAENLLGNREDAEECLNDALLRLWENIPPTEPDNLGGYFATVCRRLALDRRRRNTREKRGGGQPPASLDELSECIAAADRPDTRFDRKALSEAINRFLDSLPAETRVMFVLRYWYCLPVQEVAKETGCGASKVKMSLMRSRNKLRAYLDEEGYL